MYNFAVVDEVCGICGDIYLLAESLTDVFKNGCYVGDYSSEKNGKWNKALKEARKQLTKKVIKIYDEGDYTFVCTDCLRKMLNDLEKK